MLFVLPKLNIYSSSSAKKKLIIPCQPCFWILNRRVIWIFPAWLLMCLFGWLMYIFSTHRAHGYGSFIWWTFLCLLRWFLEIKLLPYSAHWFEISPIWNFMFLFRQVYVVMFSFKTAIWKKLTKACINYPW